MSNEVETVVEESAKNTKVDVKGLAVIITVATSAIAAVVFGIKKIRDKKAATAKTEETDPENKVEVTE